MPTVTNPYTPGRAIGDLPTINQMYGGITSNPWVDYAVQDWRSGLANYSGMMKQNLGGLAAGVQRYMPGASYGAGQRKTSQEAVQAGVASEQAQLAKTGMSGMAASSALNVAAGSELAKLYANIEDARNQQLTEAERAYASNYAQMMQGYINMYAQRPKWGTA